MKVVAALLATGAFVCGCNVKDTVSSIPPDVVRNTGDTIAYDPSSVGVVRTPALCGEPDPPYAEGDQFALNTLGNDAQGLPNELDITFSTPLSVVVGQPILLMVGTMSQDAADRVLPGGGVAMFAMQSASQGNVFFAYTQGADPDEVDMGAFQAVIVTFLTNPPQADGDILTIRLQIEFADGRVLDDTFSAVSTTVEASCPEG